MIDIKELSLKKGKIYGLVGENGAGKTTLIRLLSGLLLPDGGEVHMNENGMRMGLMIEKPAIDLNLTAKENLIWLSKVYGFINCVEIEELLKIVQLDDALNKKVKNFSLGMKQRLGVAMCLLNNPQLLLLDEPMNGLDPKGMMDLRKLLMDLNQKGTTILISSHILGELYKLATDYLFIKKGKIIAEKTGKELEDEMGRTYKLITSDNAKAAQLLENEFNCSVHSSGDVLSFDFTGKEILQLSKKLSENKAFILDLHEEEFDIEKSYLRIMEEA